jgi:hypothetical protein
MKTITMCIGLILWQAFLYRRAHWRAHISQTSCLALFLCLIYQNVFLRTTNSKKSSINTHLQARESVKYHVPFKKPCNHRIAFTISSTLVRDRKESKT